MKDIILSAVASAFMFTSTYNIVKPTTDVIKHGLRSNKEIALTFDADMTVGMLEKLKSGEVKSYYNEEVTTTLVKEHLLATIFITGLWAETYPEIVKKFLGLGYEIENHSYDHNAFNVPCYRLQKTTDKVSEITKAQSVLEKITGLKPSYFRFPGGCYAKEDTDLVKSNGLKVVEWDVVSGDSSNTDPQAIASHVLSKVKNGSIIVMHISGGHAVATAQALKLFLPSLKKEGYSFVTVSKLLDDSGI